MRNDNQVKYFRLISIITILLYYIFAVFFQCTPDFDDPMTMNERVFGSMIFILILFLSYINEWVKNNLSNLILLSTVIISLQMIYISINSNFPAFLALSIMIVVALMNLTLDSGKLLFSSNLVIAVTLGLGLLLTAAT
ncbi:MAG TPA: hypothetical protein VJ962_10465, partial [Clostridia bacterium]|nr:hypothetical protein [Clostridia bacterium]